jgi:hypothetical protein
MDLFEVDSNPGLKSTHRREEVSNAYLWRPARNGEGNLFVRQLTVSLVSGARADWGIKWFKTKEQNHKGTSHIWRSTLSVRVLPKLLVRTCNIGMSRRFLSRSFYVCRVIWWRESSSQAVVLDVMIGTSCSFKGQKVYWDFITATRESINRETPSCWANWNGKYFEA